MTPVVWTPRARQDLLDIYCFIAAEQPTAAERIFDRIETIASLLSLHPRMGVRRPELRPSARMLVEGNLLLLYETVPDKDQGKLQRVRIVRVIDGRRDVKRMS